MSKPFFQDKEDKSLDKEPAPKYTNSSKKIKIDSLATMAT